MVARIGSEKNVWVVLRERSLAVEVLVDHPDALHAGMDYLLDKVESGLVLP